MTTSKDPQSSTSKSRRDFLRVSGATAAATALAGVAVPPCHAAEDSTIKLALVGCGGRGTGAVTDALAATGGPVKLVAMADLFEPRLKSSLSRIGQRNQAQVDVPAERRFLGFDAYKKAIDCLSPGDVVLLTTHAAFRPLHFEYAVDKGVNVFMEKSFAVDTPALHRLLKATELAEQKNLKVGVGFMWRHSKARQEVIKRIHDGAIGDVQMLRIYRMQGTPRYRARSESTTEVAHQIQNANQFTWVSSGLFIDWHCHNVDVACWTKGSWPVSAQGFGGRCFEQAGTQFDHYSVEYTYADGTKLFAYTRYINGCWNRYSDHAQGTRGSATIMTSLTAPRPMIFKGQNSAQEDIVWKYTPREPNPYREEWQVLLDAIRQDKPHNEARRAGEANLTALMGRMASHTGQFVTNEQAMNSEFQFVADIDHMTMDTTAPVNAGPDGVYPAPLPGVTKEI